MKRKALALLLAMLVLFTSVAPSVVFAEPETAEESAVQVESQQPATPEEPSVFKPEEPLKPAEENDEDLSNPPDMGENPDHLTVFNDAEIVAPIDENIRTETLFDPAPRMMRSARSNRANNPPIIGVDHPENPGDVMLFKEAKEVPGMINTFDVTLRMEAKDSTKKSDIVLVIDTSGSMDTNGRMTAAKNAANQFVDSLLPSSTTRIAVVSFAEGVDTVQSLTNNVTSLHDAINALYAEGGTFTQAGIRQANAILSNSTADFKHIVLLSDGEPTYSYKIKSNGGYNPNHYYDANIDPNINIPQAAFQYPTRVGSGGSLTGYYQNTWLGTRYYFNNGNNAIAESKYAKADGKSVWTIALQAGATGNQVLNAVASQDQSYTADPGELAAIFAEIGGKIASAMQNCHVTDPMGAGFEIPVGEVSNVIAVPATPAPSYDTSVTPHKLIWEPGTLTLPISEGSDIKYAELKYRVVINDGILGAQGQNGQYDTNGNAQITYTDINGQEQTTPFPNPMAKPVIVEMKKVLLDSAGNVIPDSDDRTFNFNLKLQDDNQFNQDYVVKGNKSRVMTDLRIDKFYNFAETAAAGTHSGTLGDYDTTISWKTWDGSQQGTETISGTNLNGFKVPRDSSNEPLNTTITVTNKEKADGKLILKKEFDPTGGLVRGLRAEAPTYQITVVGKSLYSNEEIYRQIHAVKVGETKEITGLRYGRYFISEENLNPSFEDDYGDSNDGKVEIRIDNKTANVKVINKPDSQDSWVSLMVKKTWLGGIPTGANIGFTVQADGVYLENQPAWEKLSNGELQAFGITAADNEEYYQAKELLKYNTQGLPIAYTITETDIPTGYVSTVPAEPTEVTYGVSPNEAKFLQWAVSNAPQKDITVTKQWNDADNLDRAGVTLTLYRQIENGTPEAVTGADVFTPSLEKTTNNETHTWTALPLYNSEGKAYTYFVKEVFTDSNNVNNQNWQIVENNNVAFSDNGGTATIINEATAPDGQLTVKKVLKNVQPNPSPVDLLAPRGMRGEPLSFSFTVTGPGGYSETFALKAGEEKILRSLYYGEYTVTETAADGFDVSYDPADGKVTLTKTAKEAMITVTNTNNGGANVAKTVEKVWVNGPKPATTIELWRKGYSKNDATLTAPDIDEKVGTFDVPENASGDALKKTFEGLLKYDPSGREFDYYVKEPNVPEGYTANIDGLTVTNTFYSGEAISVDVAKIWVDHDNQDGKRPASVAVKLYADGNYTGKVITLMEANHWKGTFTGLAQNAAPNRPINYTVEEMTPAGYQATVTGTMQTGFTITNTATGTPNDQPGGYIPWGYAFDATAQKGHHKAYIQGYPDGTVRPEGNMTRAEAAAVVIRLAGISYDNKQDLNYADTEKSGWYNGYLNVATQKGMLLADGNKLRPDDPITRGEFARMLAVLDVTNGTTNAFTDAKGHRFEQEINQMFGNRRIEGYEDGTFRPDHRITRAEVATILNRMCNRVIDEKGLGKLKHTINQYTDLNINTWYYYEIVEATNSHEFDRTGTTTRDGRAMENWIKLLTTHIID